MSFITLAIVNSVLTSIEAALQAGHEIDHGVLGSFNAGISHLLLSGREPAAPEIAALQSLAAAIVHNPESDDEEAIAPAAPPSETPSVGGEGVITPVEALPLEDPALGADAPASEAAGDAEASQASVTPGAGEPAPVAAEPLNDAALHQQAPERPAMTPAEWVDRHSPPEPTAHEELFQEQSHGEDDGA